MSFSCGFLLTNCRIHSAACVTVVRLCVRPVLWPCEFPLVMGLRSTDSAVACAPLFAGFAATMPMSDSFGSFIFGPASRLSSAVPATTRRNDPKISQVPIYDVRTCLSSSTPWSPVGSRRTVPTGVAFDRIKSLGTPHDIFYDAP